MKRLKSILYALGGLFCLVAGITLEMWLPQKPVIVTTPQQAKRILTVPAGLSAPLISGERIVLGGMDSSLYLLEKGKIIQTQTKEGIFSAPPLFEANIFYAGNEKGLFAAYALNDSTPLWQFEADAEIKAPPVFFGKGTVVFGAYDANLYALNKKNGKLKWKVETGSFLNASPAVDEARGWVVAGGCDGMIRLIDAENGQELWQFEAGTHLPGGVVAEKGAAYGATHDGKIVAVDLERRHPLWIFDGSDSRYAFLSPPCLAGSTLFIGDERGALLMFDAQKGTLLCAEKFDAKIFPGWVEEKVLYASDADGKILRLSLPDLKIIDSVQVGTEFNAPPIRFGNGWVITDLDGNLYQCGA